MTEIKEKFCCETMERNFFNKGENAIDYSLTTRLYTIVIANGHNRQILFCPWCGKQFPKYLGEEWENTLLKEYSISNRILEDYGIKVYAEGEIPDEFKTDEWWKKRGL
jgi:hypothetical protein